MSQQLPPFWEARVDPATNYTYYFNSQTGVSQWEPPAAQQPQQQQQQSYSQPQQQQSYSQQQPQQQQQRAMQQPQQPQQAGNDLEPGWEERFDPASNHPYYFNPSTGVSQWDKPIRKQQQQQQQQPPPAFGGGGMGMGMGMQQQQHQPQQQQMGMAMGGMGGGGMGMGMGMGGGGAARGAQKGGTKQAGSSGPPTVTLEQYTPPLSEAMEKIVASKLADSNDQGSKTYKFVVVGAGAVGKSALVVRFIKNDFVADYDPTIEDSYRRQYSVDGVECLLDILDTAGQEEYSALRDNYMRNGEGFMTVFAVNSRMTFSEIPDLIKQILLVKDRDEVPIIIVGSKCDLNATVPQKDLRALCDQFHIPFAPCSALGNINVEGVFSELVRFCRKIGVEEKKKKGGCSVL